MTDTKQTPKTESHALLSGVVFSTGCVICGTPTTTGIGNVYQMTHKVCQKHIDDPNLRTQINRINEARKRKAESEYNALTGNGHLCLSRL
jgi:MinD-like ATPase involved in chromosome partitioning or flagellar assembly